MVKSLVVTISFAIAICVIASPPGFDLPEDAVTISPPIPVRVVGARGISDDIFRKAFCGRSVVIYPVGHPLQER